MDLAKLQFSHDAWSRLTLTLPDGTVHADVEPIRCFPLTAPSQAIAFVNAHGKEVLHLAALEELPPAARVVLERELSAREFAPVIQRIHSSSGPFVPCVWQVQTDRGETRVSIDSEDDVRRIGPHGAQIADTSGLRFLIPDVRTLDSTSQRCLRTVL